LHDSALAQEFEHATMLLFRLAPYDYHRFHIPIDARVSNARYIFGCYESVNPLAYAAGVQPLTENLRYVISLFSDHFGHVLMVPVGAAMVGSVIFTYEPHTYQKKGTEAGYFQFGGSSVVLLFKPTMMTPQEQFLQHSLQGFETAVKMGQKITK
jgi:phosphatidylserine decarboxylase